jgi:hypothetical protein
MPCPAEGDRWSFAQNAKAVRKTRHLRGRKTLAGYGVPEGGRDMTLLRDGLGWDGVQGSVVVCVRARGHRMGRLPSPLDTTTPVPSPAQPGN